MTVNIPTVSVPWLVIRRPHSSGRMIVGYRCISTIYVQLAWWPVINLKFQLTKTDKQSFFRERRFPLATFPQGRLAVFSNHHHGNLPSERRVNFLHESDDALRHTHHSFPWQRHRDGETVSRTISSTIEVSFLQAVIAPRSKIEYSLDVNEE